MSKESSPATHRRYPLGVLFVHGIGEQPEGDTLLGFGEPIIRFLRRWLAGGNPKRGGELKVERSVLTPSRLRKQVPPHSTVRVRVPDSGCEQVWLWAESWWGGEVQPPAFGRMATWMTTVGAWSILVHFTKHIDHTSTRAPMRLVLYVLALVAWLVLALALQITVITISILRILPIPAMRRRLADVLLAVTGILGDCYVLIESDLQRAAIVDKTRDALQWVSDQCESVMVIAHSQGAAVAHMALREHGPDNVRMLFTFGSGLGKLEELLRLRDFNIARQAAQLTPVFFLLLAAFVHVAFFEERTDATEIALWMLGVTTFFAAIWLVVGAQAHWEWVEQWLPKLKLGGKDFRWLDVFATRDPVPNGALSPRLTPIATETKPIRNLASVFGDHTAYWQNRTEFVPIVAKEMARCAGLVLFDPKDLGIEEAATAHHRHVTVLSLTSWSCAAAVALAVRLHTTVVGTLGENAQRGLEGLGGLFAKGLQVLFTVVGWFVRDGHGDAAVIGHTQQVVLGTLIAILVIPSWRRVYQMMWQAWDESTIDHVTVGRRVEAPLEVAFWTIVGSAPLIFVIAWPWLRHIVIGKMVALAWSAIMIALACSIIWSIIQAVARQSGRRHSPKSE